MKAIKLTDHQMNTIRIGRCGRWSKRIPANQRRGTNMQRKKTGLGRSNDNPAAVKIEMRAAALVEGAPQSKSETDGYRAHIQGRDVPPGCEAGWLERELSMDYDDDFETDGWPWDVTRPIAEQYPDADPTPGLGSPDAFVEAVEAEHARVTTLIASAPDIEPPADWQDRALARIDAGDLLDAMSPEQIAELDAMTRGMSIDGSCELPTLDGMDQSEPAPEPSEPLVEQQDIHSEPTHVGVVDERFDKTEEE